MNSRFERWGGRRSSPRRFSRRLAWGSAPQRRCSAPSTPCCFVRCRTREPDRLVRIYTDSPPNRFPFSVADYRALDAQQTTFEQIAAYASNAATFSDGVSLERVKGRSVSPGYFTLLGLRPALVDRALDRPRSLSALIGGLAASALVLSIIGIYGVMAYHVQQHTKEIAVRVALGGTARDVLRPMLGQGMSIVAIGVAIGLGGALALARLAASLLFGVGAGDPATIGAVCALLLTTALVACLIPALRAVAIPPGAVLRND